MKFVDNGLIYDTDKATSLGTIIRNGFGGRRKETLYFTKNGRYFVVSTALPETNFVRRLFDDHDYNCDEIDRSWFFVRDLGWVHDWANTNKINLPDSIPDLEEA